MSSRALRRLQRSLEHDSEIIENHQNVDSVRKPSHLKLENEDNTPHDDSSCADELSEDNHSSNRFNLLFEEHNEIEEELKEHSDQDKPKQQNVQPTVSKSKKKNKGKRKNKKKQEALEEVHLSDELEALVQTEELEDLPASTHSQVSLSSKNIFTVEHKHLNPESELIRIFGSRVIRADNNNRRQRQYKKHKLVQPKTTWPQPTKSGLSMTHLTTSQNIQYFAFQHNQNYQRAQQLFLDAVESINPHNIMEVMRVHPYHIDTLLQMSDLSRLSEDMAVAADLIERSLYAQESACHPLFSFTSGTCQLDYRYPENRAFMISLFRHIIFVGLKGCYRTSLEFCKLLLSLCPDDDPLGVLLMIDFYSLMSHEYDFLTSLFNQWQLTRNLLQLPNFAFSVPLAMYKQSTSFKTSLSQADSILQDSLIMFPQMLLPLLDACSVKPDSTVSSHSFFSACISDPLEPVPLQQLCTLYIARCNSCWKDPQVMAWLEGNVKVVLDVVDKGDSRVESYRQKRRLRYRGAPLNVYRHILLSDVKEVTVRLPPEISRLSIRNYDPLPPEDSIVSYTCKPKRTRLQDDNGYLRTFLRSLLPNFNAAELAEEGAAGGPTQVQTIQQGVDILMAAMRDLLRNIQPVAPPVENDHGDPERDDEEWD